MPELPEVETVRRALALKLPGRRIEAVRGRRARMRRLLDPPALARSLAGRRLALPRRRGKYLLLDTEDGGALLIHLGMSGHLQLVSPGRPVEPHTHLAIRLDDGRELRLTDPRRFGFAAFLPRGAEAADPSLAGLGPDALDDAIEGWLPPLLKARRAPLKALLLDQRLVAGLGNIYATEALFRAGIRPSRPGNATSSTRLRRLAGSVRNVLLDALSAGGTTLRDHLSPDGTPGYFQVELDAYGRAGLPCRRCGALLHTARIAGRSTVWCPSCQR